MTNTLIRPVTTSCYLALFTSKTILVFQSLVTAVKFFFSLAKVIKLLRWEVFIVVSITITIYKRFSHLKSRVSITALNSKVDSRRIIGPRGEHSPPTNGVELLRIPD